MDVTKHNFAQILPEFSKVLADCDFVSFDLEFTGLFTTSCNGYLNTQEQHYQIHKDNIKQFQLIQFGLSIFKRVQEDKYECHSYNFYIFPSRCNYLPAEQRDRYFLSQASSLMFLVENGFDFNKLIRDGISYVSLSQMECVKERVHSRVMNNDSKIEVESEEDKAFISQVLASVKQFVQSEEKELIFEQNNSYHRRLIYETVQGSEFNESVDLSSGKKADQCVIICKKISVNKQDKAKKIFEETIGFTMVIELLVKHQKPIVGHNIYLDLLYIYNTFVAPLPESYAEYKTSFHSLFPKIYDTKYISSIDKLKNFIPNSMLKELYSSLKTEPFLPTEVLLKNVEAKGEEAAADRYHEAGFDSYQTGLCFIAMIRFLYAQQFNEVKDTWNNEILESLCNKVAIIKNYDIKFINFGGDDVIPSRNNVFHTTFPSSWKRKDLYLVFGEFGGLSRIVFLNDESAFCILKEPNNSANVVDRLIVNPKGTQMFKIRPYWDYVNSRHGAEREEERNGKHKITASEVTSSNNKKMRKDTDSIATSHAKPAKMTKTTDKLFDDNQVWNKNS